MAYEKGEITPIVSSTNQPATASQPSVRTDDLVIDHKTYRARPQRPASTEAKSGQVDIDDSSPEESKASTEETVTLSPAAAALARKEQKYRQQVQDLKAKEKALEADRNEISELRALKAKLHNKDYSGLESLVPYDDYTNYLIEKGAESSPEQEQLSTLKSEIENIKKSQQDEIDKRFEAAVSERRKAVTDLVDKDESYSSIKELSMQEAVVQHILDTWEHDNVDLSPEQAAKEVEEILIEKANKWTALSKIKSQSKAEDEKKQLPPLKPGIKTLTNNMAAIGEIKRPQRSFANMSDSERYKEARRRVQEKQTQRT